jgi:pyridoxamine 5'-phosphate oxidase
MIKDLVIPADPFSMFGEWLEKAVEMEDEDARAMCLSTAGLSGKPTARIVLLKGFNGSGFIFFTNYQSKKAADLVENPYVALTFHWKSSERQVRITGKTRKLGSRASSEYYDSRPLGSRISAAISPQSREISGRNCLESLRDDYLTLLDGKEPGRPSSWGGMIVVPLYFEFWQGREDRLHDRLFFKKKRGGWRQGFLAP